MAHGKVGGLREEPESHKATRAEEWDRSSTRLFWNTNSLLLVIVDKALQ